MNRLLTIFLFWFLFASDDAVDGSLELTESILTDFDLDVDELDDWIC